MGIGEVFVWLVLALIVYLCIRDLLKNLHSGSCGGCTSCGGGSCGSCHCKSPEDVHRNIQEALRKKEKETGNC